jgi:hypothetical protein
MRGQPVRYVDFRGGLNKKAAPYLIAENQCRDCLNVVSTVRGSIKKRNGNVTLATGFPGTPSQITSLVGVNVGANVLIAAGGDRLFSISVGGVIQDITGGLGLVPNLRWEFITGPTSGGQGPVFGLNGSNTPVYWTGAGGAASWTASVGSVPNGKYIQYAANRVWVAGTTAFPSRLYFSDLGDPRSWTATNVVDLDPNDGQQITGIVSIGGSLIVFKQSKTYLIYDLDTGANRLLSNSVGCVAPRSIANGPSEIYFLSEDQGVFVANTSKLQRVSDDIQPIFDELPDGYKNLAAGTFYNDHYYLSCAEPNTTINSMTLDYDTTTKSWWKHSNGANQFALWRATLTSDLLMYSADASDPHVEKNYVPGIFQDNTVNYTTQWTGPWLAFKEPYRHKRGRQIHIEGRGHVDVYQGTNFIEALSLIRSDAFSVVGGGVGGHTFGDTTLFGGTEIFGDQIQQGEVRVFSLGVARSFSFKFQSIDENDIEIDAYTMMITPRAN